MTRVRVYRAFSYWRHIYCGAAAVAIFDNKQPLAT